MDNRPYWWIFNLAVAKADHQTRQIFQLYNNLHKKAPCYMYLLAFLLSRDLIPRPSQRKSAAVVGGWTTATGSVVTAIVTCGCSHLQTRAGIRGALLHNLETRTTPWTGTEVLWCDGQTIARRATSIYGNKIHAQRQQYRIVLKFHGT